MMAVPKLLKTVVTAAVLLTDITQTNACSCIAVYYTPCDYVKGVVSAETSLVIRATALSRSDQTDINDDVTYTVDVTTVFKGDTGGEDEITFVTGGNSAACGIVLEIGEEYVLALSPFSGNPFEPPTGFEGLLAVNACGLWRKWSDIPDDEKDALGSGCVDEDLCFPACDENQVCVQYLKNGRYYCSDTCDDFSCSDGEQCTTQPKSWCRNNGYEGCPKKRKCS